MAYPCETLDRAPYTGHLLVGTPSDQGRTPGVPVVRWSTGILDQPPLHRRLAVTATSRDFEKTPSPKVDRSYHLGHDDGMPRVTGPAEALIVVDVQMAFVSGDEAVPAAGHVLQRIKLLVEKARAAGALIVYLQNDGAPGEPDEPGTPGWELHLPPQDSDHEIVIRKSQDDGFDGTQLEELLDAHAIHILAVCGVLSEMCVSATVRTAMSLGFQVILPHDAHATYGVPASELSDPIPAAVVSRVAEWALGYPADPQIAVLEHANGVAFATASDIQHRL